MSGLDESTLNDMVRCAEAMSVIVPKSPSRKQLHRLLAEHDVAVVEELKFAFVIRELVNSFTDKSAPASVPRARNEAET